MQLTRNLFIPFIDTSKGKVAGTYKWAPIDLSTKFELSYNPQTDTKSYINSKNDTTVVTGYQPELPQEIVLDNTNPLYKFMDEFLNSYPVGADCKVPVMIVRPALDTGKPTVAQVWDEATVTGDTLNTVDGNVSFKLSLNGDPINGTVTGIGTTTVTFRANAVVGA